MRFPSPSFSRGLAASLVLAAVLPLAAQALPAAAPTAPASPAGLVARMEALAGQTTRFSDPAISPDGTHLAWRAHRGNGKGAIFLLDRSRPGAAPRRVAPGSDPVWSPDSTRLAFLSDPDSKGQDQIWVAKADGSRARAVSALKGYVAKLRWSPDGRRLACLHVPDASGGGPLGAAEPRVGEVQSVIHNQRIAVVDPGNGALHFASPGNLHVYGYDWAPDGKHFAATAAPGPGDDNWWIAQLYVTDAATGEARPIYHPRWQIAVPRWSPDGSRIAFIEGLMSDEGFHGGDLRVVSSAGGTARNLTPGRPASPSGMIWRSDDELLFTETSGGGSALAAVRLDTGAVSLLWEGETPLVLGGYGPTFSLAADGRTSALVQEGFGTPPEILAGPIGHWAPVTRANAGVQAPWGRAESLTWHHEGLAIQGWLVHPAGERAGRQYPLIVAVHGGPSGANLSIWDPTEVGLLSMAGYFVLLPNPRGSYGQGEAFTQANVKDFGGGDLRDILAGVDAVLASRPVDPKRLGVMGWSYGGYMTMWAVTQTHRFAAAVAGAGVANWKSYYGENAIDQWMIPFFGASVYDDPAVYAKSSPIEFIKQVRTPTLVLVGERDAECPAPQSFEFWHALKALGVPTSLVVYPGEGHRFTQPAHLRDRSLRTLAWFGRYLE